MRRLAGRDQPVDSDRRRPPDRPRRQIRLRSQRALPPARDRCDARSGRRRSGGSRSVQVRPGLRPARRQHRLPRQRRGPGHGHDGRDQDPQWLHTDAQAASGGHFGGSIASGWHTCAMAMQLAVEAVLEDAETLASPSVAYIKWPHPVRPGDRLTLCATVLEARTAAGLTRDCCGHGQPLSWAPCCRPRA
ncbi:MAG: hypothetical protein E6H79_06550 [Betaproteobacteria bacterium]|nr:MAG: hypothetical protein E6H79_06550 [Betaproteobacteria bacterium]